MGNFQDGVNRKVFSKLDEFEKRIKRMEEQLSFFYASFFAEVKQIRVAQDAAEKEEKEKEERQKYFSKIKENVGKDGR